MGRERADEGSHGTTEDQEGEEPAEREVGRLEQALLDPLEAGVELGQPLVHLGQHTVVLVEPCGDVRENRRVAVVAGPEVVVEPRAPPFHARDARREVGDTLVGGVGRRLRSASDPKGLFGDAPHVPKGARVVVEKTRVPLLRPLDLRHIPGDSQGGGELLRELVDLLLELVQGGGLRGRPLSPGLAEHPDAQIGELTLGLDRAQDDAQVVRGGTSLQVAGEGVHALHEPGVAVLQGLQPLEGGLVLLRGNVLELGHCRLRP